MSEAEDEDEVIYEQASSWCGRIRSGEIYDHNAFEAWIAADVRHRRACDDVMEAWDLFNSDPTSPRLLAMRSEALADAHRAGARQWRTPFSIDRRALVAGLTAAVVVPAAGLFAFNHAEAREFSTGVGELKNVDLPDGSKMYLDANSIARISFSMARRYVELVNGRARFNVAKHQGSAFQVAAGKAVVTATGTEFTAEFRRDILEVVLLEGTLRVEGQGQSHNLSPRQSLSWSTGAQPIVNVSIDLDKATSWENGEIFFENTKLVDAIERLNDYSKTKLQVADARTGQLRISGMFLVGQTNQFVDAVKSYYPVVDVATADSTITLWAKESR